MMIGSAGMNYALELLRNEKEGLEKRYPSSFLLSAEKRLCNERDRIKAFEKTLPEPWDCTNEDRTWLCPMHSDGVFGALWIMGETLMCGLRANLYDIPIDQAVIELCDYKDVNPYEADSIGAYLIATFNPGKVLKYIEANGLNCKIIGYSTPENARVVIGATERYLTKPEEYR